jgi:TP901 family phage tail tape measure protein
MASATSTAVFAIVAKDAASAVMGKVGKSMGKLRSVAGVAFKAIAASALAAAGAMVAFAVDGIKKAAAFQTAMLNVNSIAKATPAAFKEMQDSVLEMSKRLPQSAETLAQGLYDISSSGFAGADGIKVLEAAAKAASAGLAQTSESAAGITAVLNAYSYGADEAQRVSDILFKIVDRGVITFPELAQEIGKVTALSSPLGVSLEDVGAGLAVLTKNGIDGANATTQLNAIMQAVLKPSAAATKVAGSLGINLSAAGLKAKGFSGFLADMIEKTGGSSEKMARLLGNSRAIRGAFVLAKNGGEQFNEELALMQNAAGATDTALSYQEQGLQYQLDILNNKFNAVAIEVGNVFIPKLVELVGFVEQNLLPAFSDFATGLATGVGTAIGDLAAEISKPGGLIESVGEVVGSIVDDFKPELDAAATALTGPDGLFTAVSKLIGALWGDGEGALAFAFKALGLAIESAFAIAKPFFDALTWLVDNIAKVIEALNKVSGAESQAKIKTSQDAAAASNVFGMGANTGSGFTANLSVNLDGRTIAESTDSYLGRRAVTGGTSRIYP